MKLETKDIQGMLLSGYANQTSAAYLFVRFVDKESGKNWLREALKRVTPADGYDRDRKHSLNIALSRRGLERLGLSGQTMATFSRPFIEGMSQRDRARQLGDQNVDSWDWGKPDDPTDMLLMLFATDLSELSGLLASERKLLNGRLIELSHILSHDLPARAGHLNSEEHFGFVDGISQPMIAGYRDDKSDTDDNRIKPGEFVLGYDNEYGQITAVPTLEGPDTSSGGLPGGQMLGKNGSYLVVRQLAQDVAGFWNMLRLQARGTAPSAALDDQLAAKIVGRWRDGTPVTTSPDQPQGQAVPENSFGYLDDAQGLNCPLGAHARRANPRDGLLDDPELSIMTVKRHRLLRRGRSYGEPLVDRYNDDGQPRGLVFVVINANIERQFEFVQSAWISSPNFAGLYDEADPLIGGRTEKPGRFTIPQCPVRDRRQGILPHVSVKGGAYFFLPGLLALGYLAR